MDKLKQVPKKAREQTFCEQYKKDFPTIAVSHLSNKHAFCKICHRDFSISHGGRSDITQHIKTKLHQNAVASNSEKNNQLITMFGTKNSKEDEELIRAEALFASFYLEHNIPLSASDHMGQLLRAAFPNSEEIKKFHSGRTKTTAIIKAIATEKVGDLVNTLKLVPYSIATDGSHTSDSKLYPIVVTYPDVTTETVKCQLLSIPSLENSSSGENIAQLMMQNLEQHNIPIENCISLGSDNAPVMLGKKAGVIAHMRLNQPDMISIGCPCHLINLAAQHASNELPVSISDLLIDIFYYMEGSVNRKLRLKELQELHGEEVQKVLKHACTRWLSLGLCLGRVNRLWGTLLNFFKEQPNGSKGETKTSQPLLQSYVIPKSKSKRKAEDSPSLPQKKIKKTSTSSTACKPQVIGSKEDSTKLGKKASGQLMKEESRVDRIRRVLSCNLVKAFSHFLSYSIASFENVNKFLQTREPQVANLKQILNDLLKQQMAAFVKPVHIAQCEDVRYLNYKDSTLHKSDVDISVGSSTLDIVEEFLEGESLLAFYSSVKRYYMKACDYIIANFPLTNDVLVHAEVANIQKSKEASFSSVRYFVKKFPVMLLKEEGESVSSALDQLESEFTNYTLESFSFDSNILSLPADKQWFRISKIVNSLNQKKFSKLAYFMLGLLTIPHSNAECERLFSQVRKNKTDFRGAMSNDTLSAILIAKTQSGPCFDQKFTSSFLKKAKSATWDAVQKKQ